MDDSSDTDSFHSAVDDGGTNEDEYGNLRDEDSNKVELITRSLDESDCKRDELHLFDNYAIYRLETQSHNGNHDFELVDDPTNDEMVLCDLANESVELIDSVTMGDLDKLQGVSDVHKIEFEENTGNISRNSSVEKLSNEGCDDKQVDNGWDDWQIEDPSILDVDDNSAVDTSFTLKKKNEGGAHSVSENAEKPTNASWTWGGFSGFVNVFSDGISNVLESSLGMPPAEELAKLKLDNTTCNKPVERENYESKQTSSSLSGFLTGIGTDMVTGSLDLLESLGKKTYEKLTVQNTDRRRFIFEPEKEQQLSDLLKALRESQRMEEVHSDENLDKKVPQVNLIDLFEKNGGFVHLEGLEMLSSSYLKKSSKFRDRKEVDNSFANLLAKGLEDCHENELFSSKLQEILKKIGLPYDGSSLTDIDKECFSRISELPNDYLSAYNECLEVFAEITANGVKLFHKLGQLLLIAEKPPSSEAFGDLLSLLGRRISFFSNQFINKFSMMDSSNNSSLIDELVTNIILSVNDSFLYLQQSLRLLEPLITRN